MERMRGKTMNKDNLKRILSVLYWYKDDLGNDEKYLLALLDMAKEINDVETELSIRNILEIEGRL